MGNAAESGSGGGIALQNVNGTDVVTFPTRQTSSGGNGQISVVRKHHQQHHHQQRSRLGWRWYLPAGCAGHQHHQQHHRFQRYDSFCGSALQHPRRAAGQLQGPAEPTATTSPACPRHQFDAATRRTGQHPEQRNAGRQSSRHVTCPAGHHNRQRNERQLPRVLCARAHNNVFWQNRTFHIGVGALGAGGTSQQNVVSLLQRVYTATPAPTQPKAVPPRPKRCRCADHSGGTGACATLGANAYWDIGVRGDLGPTDNTGGTFGHEVLAHTLRTR